MISDIELYCKTFDLESELTEAVKPWVLDAGSIAYEDNVKHTDACGWLAIRAALSIHAVTGTLPRGLEHLITTDNLTVSGLKHFTDAPPNERIRDCEISTLAEVLGITIIVWEQGETASYGSNDRLYIRLWKANAHYTVWLSDDRTAAEHLARVDPSMCVKILRPLSDEKNDYEFARRLQEEWNAAS